MQKLEIIDQFRNLYGEKLNPELISIKYCQTPCEAFVEMIFINDKSTPSILNLDFMAADFEQEDINEDNPVRLLFDPNADIVV